MAKIKEVIKEIELGAYNIPEFQRAFVWSSQKVRDLAESIWKDYPIGSIIVWKGENIPQLSTSHSIVTKWVIDGQQRLTAICILFGIKPPWWDDDKSKFKWGEITQKYDIMVRVDDDIRDLEFAVSNPVRKKDVEWVSISKILKMNEDEFLNLSKTLAEKYFDKLPEGMKDEEIFEKMRMKIRDILKNLKDALESYDLHFIKTTHEPEDIVEIFVRINTTGTRIKETDIMIALLTILNKGWVSKEFIPYLSELKENFGFDLEPGTVVKMIAGLTPKRSTRLREVGYELWRSLDLKEYWQKLNKSLNNICKQLNDFGVLSSEIIISKNVLIPLIALHEKFTEEFNPKKALYWFIMATWDGRYGGSSDTILSKDLKKINNSNSFEDAIKLLLNDLEVPNRLEDKDFLKDFRRERFLRFLYYLAVFNNGAIDWRQKVKIGFTSPEQTIKEFKPEWHHFFPKVILNKYNELLEDDEKFEEEEINSLANITILNPLQKAFRDEPKNYITKYGVSEELLKQQFIPLDENLWKVENYREFLNERAKLMAE
ncbi:hypothetical protein DRO97_03770, partial [Archaeoglobales archaeon]